MARKRQKLAAIRRQSIRSPKTRNGEKQPVALKGHFVVYSADQRRFVLPLVFLKTDIFRELLEIAEEDTPSPSLSLSHQKHHFLFLLLDRMISLMTLVKMARKWRNSTAISRKRISFPSNSEDVEADTNGTPLIADKGHFVVYSEDKRRFVIPLVYLNNEVIRQLLKMSEEEFGLPGNGPITLPCDAFFTEYIITLIRRGVAQDLEKAMIMTICEKRCTSSSSSLHQGQTNQRILVY
ncbi:hypothetical protein RJ640_026896 [Escallonia rubra]|uniref:Small auxin up regulated protein n=1 Tax=Escallonia rubra TaxID=112253 RepID=A0AA88QUA8_9ASTE|nr:hypothetical protein RJ640_026896 [Escallonia rubra]